MKKQRSLAGRHGVAGGIMNGALIAALVLFVVGVFAPLLTLKKFFIFSNTVSLASSLIQLLQEGHYFIFALLFCFSIVVPLLKLAVLFKLWNSGSADADKRRRHLAWLSRYGKWSMLDVFVVAVLLVSVKLDLIVDVSVHYGLYAFAASILITMLATTRIGGNAAPGF